MLVVHWARSGQAWQAPAGNWTLPPGTNGIVRWLGQVSSPRSKSSVNAVLANRGPLRTVNALGVIDQAVGDYIHRAHLKAA
jgi:hypothetical protein